MGVEVTTSALFKVFCIVLLAALIVMLISVGIRGSMAIEYRLCRSEFEASYQKMFETMGEVYEEREETKELAEDNVTVTVPKCLFGAASYYKDETSELRIVYRSKLARVESGISGGLWAWLAGTVLIFIGALTVKFGGWALAATGIKMIAAASVMAGVAIGVATGVTIYVIADCDGVCFDTPLAVIPGDFEGFQNGWTEDGNLTGYGLIGGNTYRINIKYETGLNVTNEECVAPTPCADQI